MAEISSESHLFFSGNMIPESPLNKMVPLTEDHWGGGGGGGGSARGPPLAHGLLQISSETLLSLQWGNITVVNDLYFQIWCY